MPNPADPPPTPELFTALIDLALCEEPDIQRFCDLSLLSCKWSAALLGRLYSKWTYNGARQPFMTLWKSLRTVLSNPYLASLVRTLNIGNWGFYPDAYALEHARNSSVDDLHLPPDELELLRKAIREAEIDRLESSIIRSLSERDLRPLIALLLTCLPNLPTIYAHVPQSDPILGAVLRQTLDRQNSGEPSALRGL